MLTRVRRLVRKGVDLFPLTPLGVVVALASYAVLQRYGYRQRDLILFAVGALGLVLAALGLAVTLLGALLVYLSVRKQPSESALRIECNRWLETGFSVPSLWFVPFVTVVWSWREVRVEVRQRREGGRLHETVRGQRRGIEPRLVRRFEIGDAFGLARIAFENAQATEVRLYPSVGALRQVQVIRGLASGSDQSHIDGKAEGDPFDTRRYAPGDPIRFVLWKVFAKNRSLTVRTPERALSPLQHTVAYLVSGKGDEPAAGAARLAIDIGAFGTEWRIAADGAPEAVRSRDQALEVLARSATVSEQQSGAGLARFVDTAGSLGRLVVFVPPRPGPWMARVTGAVRALRGRVDFVVGTDGIARGSKLARLAARDDGGPDAVPLEDLLAVVRGLGAGASGARVVVVDRGSGHVYLPEQLTGGRRDLAVAS